jgi:hypothetical protein
MGTNRRKSGSVRRSDHLGRGVPAARVFGRKSLVDAAQKIERLTGYDTTLGSNARASRSDIFVPIFHFNKKRGTPMQKSNLKSRFGTGLSPQGFIDSMQQNKETFESGYRDFAWKKEGDRAFFEDMRAREDLRVVILAADWCGDVVRNVPVVFRVLETAEIPVDVLILEQNFDLMDEYLTMGGRSVPVVIFANAEGEVLAQWGPRPEKVQELMRKFKAENPDREAADYADNMKVVRAQMMERYGEGTSIHEVIVHELRTLLSGV